MNGAHASIRDVLYDAPGPKAKRRIAFVTVISLLALAALLAAIVRRFYVTGQLDPKYWSIFLRYTTWRFIGRGLLGTLQVAAASSVLAFAAGMLLMMARVCRYRVLNAIATFIIELSRGIPTLLFIYFFFLLAPQFGLQLPSFWRITLPVSISAMGVTAEALRSGVNAVPRGQTEAAVSLGMRSASVFFKIVFPQGFRYVIPTLISEMVIVFKDTTYAYVVNYADLMQNAKVLISNYDALLAVYLVVAVIYIVINYLINKLAATVERRTRAAVAAAK